MQAVFVSWGGNGVSGNAITGVGGQGALVLVKGGANMAVFLTASMVTAALPPLQLTGGNAASTILSIDADGFTVGSDARVNALGTTYHALVIIDDGAGDFAQGVSVGNAVNNREIVASFAVYVAVMKRSGNATSGVFRTSLHPTDNASQFTAAINLSNTIKTFTATGFTVGTSAAVNANGISYPWFAFADTADIAAISWVGDTTQDDRSIALGLLPGFTAAKGDVTEAAEMRTQTFDDDSSAPFTNTAPRSNVIQRFEANGFQIGTSNNVNQTGITYYAFGLKATARGAANLLGGKLIAGNLVRGGLVA